MKLRPYQQQSVEGIRISYRHGYKRPILRLPTGGGKTVVFSYVSNQISLRGKRALILVHRIELLRQTSSALSKFGVRHGLIHPKFTPDTMANIQVASIQTISRRLSKMKDDFDLIVVDECHHATAGTWRKTIDHFPSARVLGVTATPIRSDGKGLGIDFGGVFDDLIVGADEHELIDEGYLVKPRVFAPPSELDLSHVHTQMGDYKRTELADAVDRPKITGHAVEHYRKICSGKPAVAFCVNIKHAEHVAADFRSAGFRAYAVDGKMDDDKRSNILSGLADGRVQVVTSCDLISEGTDIPAIECAILLRPTHSLGLYIQQVGRALRPHGDKEFAIILDHVGNVIKHGMPDETREWTLVGTVKPKRNGGDLSEPVVSTSLCVECYAVFPRGPACPSCGHRNKVEEKEIKVGDGVLTEVSAEDVAKRRNRGREEFEADTYDKLLSLARSRGYKDGWAKHRWNARMEKMKNSK